MAKHDSQSTVWSVGKPFLVFYTLVGILVYTITVERAHAHKHTYSPCAIGNRKWVRSCSRFVYWKPVSKQTFGLRAHMNVVLARAWSSVGVFSRADDALHKAPRFAPIFNRLF